MRASLVLLAFISFPVFAACPQLSGNYKSCRTISAENTNGREMTITQKVVSKVMQYSFSTKELETSEVTVEKYIADGRSKVTTETDSDTGVSIRTSTLATCIDDSLIIKVLAKIENEEFANIIIRTSKTGNQLTQTFSGLSMGEPVNETTICE